MTTLAPICAQCRERYWASRNISNPKPTCSVCCVTFCCYVCKEEHDRQYHGGRNMNLPGDRLNPTAQGRK